MAIFLIVAAIGLLLIWRGRGMRTSHGLTHGRTLALDNRTLVSRRLGLAGRPDRIVEGNVPEEWKGSKRVYDSHRAQVGCYLILIEEKTGIRPTHGFIVLGNGQRIRVENTPELRAWVLEIAEKVRQVKRQPHAPITVNQPPAKCRGCGMREGCIQRSD